MCAGAGEFVVRECPWRRIKRCHELAVEAVVQMEAGILPAPGGMQDQAATFVEAYPLLVQELAHWRDVAVERARKQAEARRKR